MNQNKKRSLKEVSSELLGRYKEKAKTSADVLTGQGKYRQANTRLLNVMKATGKQIEKTTAGIKKALNKEEKEMKTFFNLREELVEKTLTPAEKKKREEVAKAIERENPNMPVGMKMAIATKTAKRVAEDIVTETKSAPKGFHFTKDGKLKRGDADTDGSGGPMLRSDPLDKQRSKVPPVSEQSYTGKGNHRPGWMIKADPKLAQKFKEKEQKHKAMVKALGNPAAGKSVKEESELEEAKGLAGMSLDQLKQEHDKVKSKIESEGKSKMISMNHPLSQRARAIRLHMAMKQKQANN